MFENDLDFENEVRRIARLLWPTAEFDGSAKEFGRERDGLFITDEMVHMLECTTSRRKEKAVQDVNKLASLAREMRRRYPTKGIKRWFVTLDEPTADQRLVARNNDDVVIIGYQQFQSMIIDATSYLVHRLDYPFGSMQDPETGSQIKAPDYISLEMTTRSGTTCTVRESADLLQDGKRLLLVGDYGAGKSTTLYMLFEELLKDYRAHRARRFPIHLNLRDHHGQVNPAEAIERHARNVGHPQPSHLVRAWRAGYAIPILDGFDEFATAGWAGQAKKLRDIRYRSMQLIREFVRNTPHGSGLILAGRAHFFDSERELQSALSVTSGFERLMLHDFTDSQVSEYLQRKGWTSSIPAWLPSRPLLLGYLASQGLLEQVLQVEVGSGPATGWDQLLERTCNREAQIEAGIDGGTVRLLIERLATTARRSSNGISSLQQTDLIQAFQQVCGYPPDDRGIVLLQRLPGLGATSQEDGSRDFIDHDFADAARAGDIVRYVEEPFSFDIGTPSEWQVTLGQLGKETAAFVCNKKGFKEGKFRIAAQKSGTSEGYGVVCADVIQTAKEMHLGYRGEKITIKDVMLRDMSFGDAGEDFSRITFRDCLFQCLDLPPEADLQQLPSFAGCYIGLLEGRVSTNDLPHGILDSDCVIDSFGDGVTTTSAILGLMLPQGGKVLLTILRKLVIAQPGSKKEPLGERALRMAWKGERP